MNWLVSDLPTLRVSQGLRAVAREETRTMYCWRFYVSEMHEVQAVRLVFCVYGAGILNGMKLRDPTDYIWHQKLGRPYRLHCQQYGRGKEQLLLLHGLASSHKIWKPLINLAGKDYKIIAPDLLGFGRSPTPAWAHYDVSMHAKHVRALMRRFGVAEDQPVTIVAHSMGCLIAVHMAYEYPHLVKRLILYEPPLFADEPGRDSHRWLQERYFTTFRYIASHPQLLFSTDGALRRQLQRLTGIVMHPGTWLPFKRSLENTIMAQQAYDELRSVIVPTDIVYGRMDFVVMRSGARAVLNSNPHITFHLRNRMHGISGRAAKDIAVILSNTPTNAGK